jgi:hypothetical protein
MHLSESQPGLTVPGEHAAIIDQRTWVVGPDALDERERRRAVHPGTASGDLPHQLSTFAGDNAGVPTDIGSQNQFISVARRGSGNSIFSTRKCDQRIAGRDA